MKNKKELVNKDLEENRKNKRLGVILLCVGLGIATIAVLSIIFNFFGIKNPILNGSTRGFINKVVSIISSGVFSTISLGLIIAGIILIIVNDNKIKKDAEKVIPKAKETLKKAEPVVTDVIKTVGEGIEDIAHNVKETIDKNKNNKKGE